MTSPLIDSAIAINRRLIGGFDKLAPNVQARFSLLMLKYQQESGLEPDAAYDSALERALNGDLRELGYEFPGMTPSLPGPRGFTAAEVVARALAQVEYSAEHDKESDYGLGHGAPWTAPNVFARDGLADCSATTHYCDGTIRGPYNTDAMVADAYARSRGRYLLDAKGNRQPGPQKLYVPVADDDVRPGDTILYPGVDRNHDGKREGAGHCGKVVDVLPGFVFNAHEWELLIRVAHCRWKHNAVRVTNGSYFDRDDTVIIRCKMVRYG